MPHQVLTIVWGANGVEHPMHAHKHLDVICCMSYVIRYMLYVMCYMCTHADITLAISHILQQGGWQWGCVIVTTGLKQIDRLAIEL